MPLKGAFSVNSACVRAGRRGGQSGQTIPTYKRKFTTKVTQMQYSKSTNF